ncbi:hypothetical protein PoB_003030700 [Plakobranchus ocellatus]|uniref:Uncharacterized protein n=1 Tax=Plakobranchus ocellatus TaxID=259542 RepID=A0AAV4A9A6_9GAST|nr:hypothetical protein PoB_003030700 [Plakobranchus ocellatus]
MLVNKRPPLSLTDSSTITTEHYEAPYPHRTTPNGVRVALECPSLVEITLTTQHLVFTDRTFKTLTTARTDLQILSFDHLGISSRLVSTAQRYSSQPNVPALPEISRELTHQQWSEFVRCYWSLIDVVNWRVDRTTAFTDSRTRSHLSSKVNEELCDLHSCQPRYKKSSM